MGFQPRFGMVFAVDKNLVGMASQAGDMINYSACVAAQGGSAGAYIEETGFTVMQLVAATNRSAPSLNTKGVTYVYIMFR